jgi:hypothetical protein
VARDDRASTVASTTRRSFSVVLLAVHLVVFLFGGALVGERAARAAGRTTMIVAVATASSDGATVTTASDGRLERGVARERGARGERSSVGAGALPLGFLVPSGGPTVGPAALIGSIDWRSASRELRPAPSVVHGARGPPFVR